MSSLYAVHSPRRVCPAPISAPTPSTQTPLRAHSVQQGLNNSKISAKQQQNPSAPEPTTIQPTHGTASLRQVLDTSLRPTIVLYAYSWIFIVYNSRYDNDSSKYLLLLRPVNLLLSTKNRCIAQRFYNIRG